MASIAGRPASTVAAGKNLRRELHIWETLALSIGIASPALAARLELPIKADLRGRFRDDADAMRYVRTWRRGADRWQLVSHVTLENLTEP